MMRMMAISLFFLGGHAALAASSVIVDDKDVADAIARNALVWDVRPADAYARGHIAGAINIGDAARVLRDDNTEDFIATDCIEKIMGAAGLDPNARPSFTAAGALGNRILVFTPCNISTAGTSVYITKASRVGPPPGIRLAVMLRSLHLWR
jgi:rhodanese-related sulfurtransferase